MAFAMSGKSEASVEILGFQFREIFENLFLRHSPGEVFKYIFHRDAHSPDARLATALIRRDCDSVMKVHGCKIIGFVDFGEDSFVDKNQLVDTICSKDVKNSGAFPALQTAFPPASFSRVLDTAIHPSG